MKKFTDAHTENDKTLAPFLLAASFNGLIHFVQSYTENGVLFWEFSPKKQALELVNTFHTKTEPHIPAKDLFEATATFWKQIAQARNGEKRNEGRL